MGRRDRGAGSGLDGILVVAKPPGPTSHDVVALVRRLSATKRVGHGGTLDPFAGGVLPVFLGRGTRLVEYHLGDRKRYRATVCFGASSTTDDLEGELSPTPAAAPTRSQLEAALGACLGPIQQRPPAYSAIKVGGRRAYALARAGEAVELQPRSVTVHALDLVSWDDSDPDRPVAVIDVECSAGTYIRSLARDLGVAVGTAAYLGALLRTASGSFTLDGAVDLDAVRAAAAEGPDTFRSLLLPIDAGLDAMPELALGEDEIAAVARGQFVRPAGGLHLAAEESVRVRDAAGRLVAIAVVRGGRLLPDKVLVDPPIRAGGDGDAEGVALVDRGPAPAADAADRSDAPRPGSLVVVDGVASLEPGHGPIFAVVGVFDGIHLGHQYLLRQLVDEAARRGARPAVITFDSHPDEVIRGSAPPLLLDPAERLRILGEAGVEVAVVQHFDQALRLTPYDQFVHEITSRISLAGLLLTPDAAFGHERRGTPETLAELGARDGFAVVVVPPFVLDGRPVSSTEIRRRVADGDLAGAERLLGRPYSIVATTTDGMAADGPADGLFRLEFPLPVALPPTGTYPVAILAGGDELAARARVEPEGSLVVADAEGRRLSGRVRVVFRAP